MRRLSLLALLLIFLTGCMLFSSKPTATPAPFENTPAPSQTSAARTAPAATQAAPATPQPTPTPFAVFPPPVNPGAPDVADYTISVRLDAASHRLTAHQTALYRNTTQKPIPDVVIHLYLNAFKSKDTIFMKESGGSLRGIPFNPESTGWINVTAMRIQGGPELKLGLLDDGTLARAVLPESVQPGQAITLEMDFEAQLPQVFARTGWALDDAGQPFFLVGQWFPKFGVWTGSAWDAYPFHGNAEFFADFGSYQVDITLPKNYVTGGTGLPTAQRRNNDGTQTVTYQAAGVIDFAWVASPSLKSASRKVGDAEIVYLYLPEHAWSTACVLDAAQLGLTRYGEWYGKYPYARLTVVDVPESGAGAGGMEYPTFITAGVSTRSEQKKPASGWNDGVEIVVLHEVAHQWFQSMLASNEPAEPWLDEGFADYATIRALISAYGMDPSLGDDSAFASGYLTRRRRTFLRDPQVIMDAKAWDVPYNDYVISAYAKPDMALLTLQNVLGEETMAKLMHAYTDRFRYGHPTTADFQKVAVEVSGQPLDWFFNGLVASDKHADYAAIAISGDSITVERQGELAIPVEIVVTFKSGAQQTVRWDGVEPRKIFTFANQPVQSFVIDPRMLILVDNDWADNRLPESPR